MLKKMEGNKSVIAALLGNIFVTIIKTAVAIFFGSASMFAESVHSFADTLNQSLLLVGLKRSKNQPTIFVVTVTVLKDFSGP